MLKQFLIGFTLAVMFAGMVPLSHAADAGPAAQTSNDRGIKVTVTPPSFSKAAQTWDFEVSLETHTQDLGDDLAKASILIADGKRYTAFDWKGAPPGGHHRKGTLQFKSVTPRPPSVELQIRLAGESAPRSFRWLLKGADNGK